MQKLYKAMSAIISQIETCRSVDDVSLARLKALAEIADYERRLLKRVEVPVHVSILHEDARLPVYANPTDAGADVSALEDVVVPAHGTVLVRTGLAVAVPTGYELQVRPRSGLSLKTKLRIANAPGTIDTGYRDEIGIIIDNLGDEDVRVEKHTRIAQLVLAQSPKIMWEVVSHVVDIPGDRGGGFGSSGIGA